MGFDRPTLWVQRMLAELPAFRLPDSKQDAAMGRALRQYDAAQVLGDPDIPEELKPEIREQLMAGRAEFIKRFSGRK